MPTRIRELFPTALEIPWKQHIDHQIAFQAHTDNAVSKTINLPANATVQTVGEAYMKAWQGKAKGVTVYRYHSKHQQVLEKKKPSLHGDGPDNCKVCPA